MMLLIMYAYIVMLTLPLGSVNMALSIVLLETLSWIFIQILPSLSTFKYLLVQSAFFLFSMVSVFWIKPLMILGFFLKTGSPPFHLWVINLLSELKRGSFVFMLTLHKILPLMLMLKLMKGTLVLIFLMISLLILTSLVVNLSNLFLVLSISSVLHSMWIIFSGLVNKGVALFYWSLYSALLLTFLFLMDSSWVKNTALSQSISIGILWLFLSGIPPFSIFWLKCHVLFSILVQMGVLLSLLLLSGSVLTLSAYYRTWHFNSLVIWMKGSGWIYSLVLYTAMLSIYF